MKGYGLSYSTAVLTGFVVAAVSISIALGAFSPKVNLLVDIAGEVGAKLRKSSGVKVTMIYHVGSDMLISNDGLVPVTIDKVIVESSVRDLKPDITLQPGEKYHLRVREGVKNVALQLSDGTIIILKSGRVKT